MNALWAIPAVVVLAGMLIAWYLVREAADAARELQRSIAQLGQVRDRLTGLRDDADHLRRSLPGRTRPELLPGREPV